MNLSVTIPQVFYDLIARVLPGFFFFFLFKTVVYDTSITINVLKNTGSENFISSLGNGLGYLFIFYLVGWLLHAFTFCSYEKKIKNKFEKKINEENEKKQESTSFTDMYQILRIINPNVGFRIVKLRAEARMIECTRTGMILLAFLVLSLFLLVKLGVINLTHTSLFI